MSKGVTAIRAAALKILLLGDDWTADLICQAIDCCPDTAYRIIRDVDEENSKRLLNKEREKLNNQAA